MCTEFNKPLEKLIFPIQKLLKDIRQLLIIQSLDSYQRKTWEYFPKSKSFLRMINLPHRRSSDVSNFLIIYRKTKLWSESFVGSAGDEDYLAAANLSFSRNTHGMKTLVEEVGRRVGRLLTVWHVRRRVCDGAGGGGIVGGLGSVVEEARLSVVLLATLPEAAEKHDHGR